MFFTKKKTFWQQYGKLLVGATIVVAIGYAALEFYDHTRKETTLKASALYDQMILGAFSENDKGKDSVAGEKAATTLVEEYKETPYAPLAALYLAKLSIEKKDMAGAKRYLEMALKEDDEGPVKPIATVRLARIYAEDKKFKEALDLLTAIEPEGYESLFAESKGDVYGMQGDKDKARTFYQAAIKLSPKDIPTSRLEIKLAELGIEEKS